jgi:hypothetical protein
MRMATRLGRCRDTLFLSARDSVSIFKGFAMYLLKQWPLIPVLCATIVFGNIMEARGQSLAQPAALAVEGLVEIEIDAEVRPAACCELAGKASCCCEPMCCPKCVTEEVEKSCWLVKSELVCIPGFRWPWECRAGDCDCSRGVSDGCVCPPKCGRVRCVNVLEQHKYTCEDCGYEWEVKCVRTSGGSCSCTNGRCPGCGCDPSCGASAAAKPLSTVQQATAAERISLSRTAKKSSSFWERLGLH